MKNKKISHILCEIDLFWSKKFNFFNENFTEDILRLQIRFKRQKQLGLFKFCRLIFNMQRQWKETALPQKKQGLKKGT